ncbi:hypothetical protein ACFLV7_03060 [Chloroflexota bacterium]
MLSIKIGRFNLFKALSVLLTIIILGAAACNSETQKTATQTGSAETIALLPTDTPTPAPSPTALQPLVILYAPPGSDDSLVNDLQSELSELAAQDGLRFDTRSQMLESDFEEDLRLVVVLPPDPGVLNLTQSYPQVQFLAIGISDLEAGGNLSIIGTGGDRPDQQGFLAGYLATVVTPDWRVGIISQGDTSSGMAARNGFVNGVVFYCGLCRPVFPPFYQYPSFYDLPGGASQEEQQVAADFLIGQSVKTVYVFPGKTDSFLMEYLAQAGLNLISANTPPTGVQNNWIASVQTDLVSSVREVWPRLVNGESGISMELPLIIANRNAGLFSPGRQRHVEKILSDLMAGYIDTAVDPLTGEAR